METQCVVFNRTGYYVNHRISKEKVRELVLETSQSGTMFSLWVLLKWSVHSQHPVAPHLGTIDVGHWMPETHTVP